MYFLRFSANLLNFFIIPMPEQMITQKNPMRCSYIQYRWPSYSASFFQGLFNQRLSKGALGRWPSEIRRCVKSDQTRAWSFNVWCNMDARFVYCEWERVRLSRSDGTQQNGPYIPRRNGAIQRQVWAILVESIFYQWPSQRKIRIKAVSIHLAYNHKNYNSK